MEELREKWDNDWLNIESDAQALGRPEASKKMDASIAVGSKHKLKHCSKKKIQSQSGHGVLAVPAASGVGEQSSTEVRRARGRLALGHADAGWNCGGVAVGLIIYNKIINGKSVFFTMKLTPLPAFSWTGANWSFILEKRGQIHKVEKVGVKSPLIMKTRVETPKSLFLTIHNPLETQVTTQLVQQQQNLTPPPSTSSRTAAPLRAPCDLRTPRCGPDIWWVVSSYPHPHSGSHIRAPDWMALRTELWPRYGSPHNFREFFKKGTGFTVCLVGKNRGKFMESLELKVY